MKTLRADLSKEPSEKEREVEWEEEEEERREKKRGRGDLLGSCPQSRTSGS